MMVPRPAAERVALRSERAKSGRHSAQLSGATRALLVQLLNDTRLRGVDELVYELAVAELARRADRAHHEEIQRLADAVRLGTWRPNAVAQGDRAARG